MNIRKSLIWHVLGTIYLDFGYIYLNSFVNHIPCWSIRKMLYRFAGMKIGKNARIGWKTIVIKPSEITLGEGCIVNEYCYLDGRGGLVLGNNVSISIYSKFISASHDLQSKDFHYASGPIVVEDCVFVGAGAIVLENSHLKEGAVLGAGSVFKGTAEEYIMYYGNPAHAQKARNGDLHYSLKHDCYFR